MFFNINLNQLKLYFFSLLIANYDFKTMLEIISLINWRIKYTFINFVNKYNYKKLMDWIHLLDTNNYFNFLNKQLLNI